MPAVAPSFLSSYEAMVASERKRRNDHLEEGEEMLARIAEASREQMEADLARVKTDLAQMLAASAQMEADLAKMEADLAEMLDSLAPSPRTGDN